MFPLGIEMGSNCNGFSTATLRFMLTWNCRGYFYCFLSLPVLRLSVCTVLCLFGFALGNTIVVHDSLYGIICFNVVYFVSFINTCFEIILGHDCWMFIPMLIFCPFFFLSLLDSWNYLRVFLFIGMSTVWEMLNKCKQRGETCMVCMWKKYESCLIKVECKLFKTSPYVDITSTHPRRPIPTLDLIKNDLFNSWCDGRHACLLHMVTRYWVIWTRFYTVPVWQWWNKSYKDWCFVWHFLFVIHPRFWWTWI